MGMFTTVVDEAGKDFQFKCGWDDCDTYRVGDKVDQKVYPDRAMAGKLLDGAYHALGDEEDRWAVIASGVLVALVPVERDAVGGIKDGSCQEQAIATRYGCKLPDPDAWTDAAWVTYAKREYASTVRRNQWAAEEYGLTLTQKADLATRRFLRSRMKEDGFARRILPPTEVSGTANAVVPVDGTPVTIRE